ncbi:hypothetical protein L9F63_025115 [Diploptera punctata]|uniref:Cathepsin L n=1 Tax=Diploptera punctata TaxID=6984 RepID=A0AAD8E5Z0_DIPPU|nr:hypothetical protein L9F63_025115 [Diploptera punctata]
MKCVIPLLMVVTACYSISLQHLFRDEWTLFKLKYGKYYENKFEDEFRMNVFLQAKEKIAKHNAEYELGLHTYTLGINRFADQLREEVSGKMNGLLIKNAELKTDGSTFITPENVIIPDEVDWRQKGAVTPVKDQANCGSCYAFSATGSLEGQHYRKTGKLNSLSEQNLVDCSIFVGNLGCGGGYIDTCFEYIKQNGGIDTEESYPYKAKDGTCVYSNKTIGATDTGYVDLASGDEEKLKVAIATIGPISVAIHASQSSFKSYRSGIYCDPDCSSKDLDHGVLVVGYGTDKETNQDYYIVKNSWGAGWGENGYLKMCRNQNNNCGIATQARYPLV